MCAAADTDLPALHALQGMAAHVNMVGTHQHRLLLRSKGPRQKIKCAKNLSNSLRAGSLACSLLSKQPALQSCSDHNLWSREMQLASAQTAVADQWAGHAAHVQS